MERLKKKVLDMISSDNIPDSDEEEPQVDARASFHNLSDGNFENRLPKKIKGSSQIVPGEEDVIVPTFSKKTAKKSQSVTSSKASSLGGQGGAREIAEGLPIKLKTMSTVFFALFINLALLVFLIQINHGLYIPVNEHLMTRVGPVVIEILLHVGHLLTSEAMNDAIAFYFGYLYTRKRGFSLCCCGFVQSNVLTKARFSEKLTYRSPTWKLLTRVSFFFTLHMLLTPLTVFTSTGIYASESREDSGTKECLIYDQKGAFFDRQFPTINYGMGLAELVFGTAVGDLRSELDVPVSKHIMAPQLIDVALDGQAIVGDGFVTSLTTHCMCANSPGPQDLSVAGVDPSIANQMSTLFYSLNNRIGLVNHLELNGTSNIVVTTLLSGISYCGGTNTSTPTLFVCKTNVFDHYRAVVRNELMTDGSPASIAQKTSTVRSIGAPANMTWLYQAMQSTLSGTFSAIPFPGNIPGTLNPMLWWTSSNLQSFSGSFLEAGLETTFAIILRLSMQRSYSVKGMRCVQNLVSEGYSFVTLKMVGTITGFIFLSGQLLFILLSLAIYSIWFFLNNPVMPGIRMAKEHSYFSLMACSAISNGSVQGIKGVMDSSYMWARLDFPVRIGESIASKEDPDVGYIVVDKPKFVTALKFQRKYL
ncbi:hypothetical protein EDD86DRAFT_104413 [Gorgonomyces haynaldii]|nr:hypothetical protein EDD86DRAFT_104413 [Gorgonomyces haynaldii]